MTKRTKKKSKKKIIRKKSKSKEKNKNLKNAQESVFKTKSDWIKKSLVNKKQYEKKYSYSLKQND